MTMPLRRSPWLAGALLLVLAAGLVAPVAWLIGSRSFVVYAGLAAIALLLFGAIERLWQSGAGLWLRHSARRKPAADPGRFRVVLGGKARRKGNGHAHDVGEGQDDGPRWVM